MLSLCLYLAAAGIKLLFAVAQKTKPVTTIKLIKAVKGKAISLQAWTGPEGSMRFRLPDFKTIGTRKW
jgi:hypothetical protein